MLGCIKNAIIDDKLMKIKKIENTVKTGVRPETRIEILQKEDRAKIQ